MNGLDSSFEALAFIPVNLSPLFSAFVHNIWAWLAFVTAAFSFWRLRALSSSHRTTSSCIPLSPSPHTLGTTTLEGGVPFTDWTTSFDDEEEEREDDEEDEGVKKQGKGVVVVGLTRGNSSNKFFTVYYEEESNNNDDDKVDDDHVNDDDDVHHDHDDDEEEEEEEEERKSDRVVIKRWGSSGSTVEMRRSPSSSSSSSSSEYDLGWYSYQDRKVIDGSVVKLWKEERESGSGGSPRSCRRSCLVGVTTLA